MLDAEGFKLFSLPDIFSKDIESEAVKIMRLKQTGTATDTTDSMVICIDHKYPSAVYNNLHHVQHLTSKYPEQLSTEMVQELFKDLTECYTHSKFTASTCRHIVSAVHQIVLMIIAQRSEIVTESVLVEIVHFLKCDSFQVPPTKVWKTFVFFS